MHVFTLDEMPTQEIRKGSRRNFETGVMVPYRRVIEFTLDERKKRLDEWNEAQRQDEAQQVESQEANDREALITTRTRKIAEDQLISERKIT